MKLTAMFTGYKANGERIKSAYRVSLQKVEVERHHLEEKEFIAEYYDDKIILKVRENS